MGINVLAFDLGINPDDLKIIVAREAEWSDTCLGLPREDEVCDPQMAPGFWVVVAHERILHEKILYEIRTNQDGSSIRWDEVKMPILSFNWDRLTKSQYMPWIISMLLLKE
jgi:hypothetical protein